MHTEIFYQIEGETFASSKEIKTRFASCSPQTRLPLFLTIKTSQIDTILGAFTRPNEVVIQLGDWKPELIVTTVGVYPNLSYKSNGVLIDDLEDHIRYNLFWRPGRSLFVNKQIAYKGIGVKTTEATEVVDKVPSASRRSQSYE